MARVVVLDAGVFIALLDGNDAHHDWAVDFFIHSTGSELVASALTLAEILVHPAKNGTADRFADRLSGLHLRVVSIDGADSSALAKLRAESGLRMPDVVVLHTALTHAQALATTDEKLAGQAQTMGLEVYRPATHALGVSA
jgi:Predicted nucleic acid-binding protein, contains PIN domain